MKSVLRLCMAVLSLWAAVVSAAEVQGVVKSLQGQRAVLKVGEREIAISLPAGTQLKPGDTVKVTLETVGDAELARQVQVLPKR